MIKCLDEFVVLLRETNIEANFKTRNSLCNAEMSEDNCPVPKQREVREKRL